MFDCQSTIIKLNLFVISCYISCYVSLYYFTIEYDITLSYFRKGANKQADIFTLSEQALLTKRMSSDSFWPGACVLQTLLNYLFIWSVWFFIGKKNTLVVQLQVWCFSLLLFTQAELCLPHPSSEDRLCASVMWSVDICPGGGSMSTRWSDAE